MKSKIFSLLSLSILALVFCMSLASAASLELDLVTSTPITVLHDQGTATITFNVSNNGATNYTTLNWSGSSSGVGSWTTLPSLTSLNVGDIMEVSAILTFPEYSSGTINAEIDLQSETSAEAQLPVTITITSTPEISVSDATIPTGANSTIITITNTGNIQLSNINLNASGDFDVSFNPSTSFNLNAGATKNITFTRTTPLDDLDLGPNSVTITATASDNTSAQGTITTERSFCDCENPGELDIKDIDFIVERGFGDDHDYWYLFDEIEVKVDIEVDGSWDIENIEVEWQLHTTDGKEIMDGDVKDFDLDYDEDKTITITFKLDDDVEDFEGEDAIFYVKATGKIDDSDAGSLNKEKTCDWDSKEIEMITNDDFVILDDFEFLETVSCGTEVQISADVWNIGDDDQDDVYVMISNTELGINEKVEIGDIDAFDDKKLNAVIKIPQDAEEKSYPIKFEVYDKDGDVYKNENDKEADFFIYINVEGGCSVESTAVVSAVLESGGKAGQEMVIKATITNTGDKLVTFTLNAAAYAEWASSAKFDKTTIILGAGESKEVLITFDVSKDVSGDKTFDIEVLSGDELIVKQPVQVSITKSGFGITGNIISEGNWYLWGIGALNIILVIIIILVAIRVAKK